MAVCCVAARSSIKRRAFVLPTVSSMCRRSGTAFSVFGWRGLLRLDALIALPLTPKGADRDEMDTAEFSLFKFKLARFPRPAWDFQYVIRKLRKEKGYGFRARLVWKKFISPEDCQREYETWAASSP